MREIAHVPSNRFLREFFGQVHRLGELQHITHHHRSAEPSHRITHQLQGLPPARTLVRQLREGGVENRGGSVVAGPPDLTRREHDFSVAQLLQNLADGLAQRSRVVLFQVLAFRVAQDASDLGNRGDPPACGVGGLKGREYPLVLHL